MSKIQILQWVLFFVAVGSVIKLGDKRHGWEFWPLYLLFTVSICFYGALNFVEGRQDVIECLQTNELEC